MDQGGEPKTTRAAYGGEDSERGQRIDKARRTCGLSVHQLAKATGRSPNTIRNYISGGPFRSEQHAEVLAEALNLTLAELLGDTFEGRQAARNEEQTRASITRSSDARLRHVEDQVAEIARLIGTAPENKPTSLHEALSVQSQTMLRLLAEIEQLKQLVSVSTP